MIHAPLTTRLGTAVVLRSLTAGDADAFAAHIAGAHEHLREHLPWPDVTSSADGARAWLSAYEGQVDGRVLVAGAWADGAIVAGVTVLHHDLAAASAHLGTWAVPAAVGRGVAGAACAATIAWARAELRLERLVWQCVTGNAPSRRLGERLGFRYEGTLRSDYVLRGVRHDTDVLSLVGAELDAFA